MITSQDKDIQKKDLQIAYLKRKAKVKETCVLLLYTALVAILCFFIKVGIDRLVHKYDFLRKRSLLSHAVIYSLIILLFFPIMGCVVTDWYLNLEDINQATGAEIIKIKLQQSLEGDNGTEIGNSKQGFIESWWNDFKSPENLPRNLLYYPTIAITNIFLAGLWYITKLGIDELVPQDGNIHASSLKISLTIVSVVALAIISVIFSMSLNSNLWREELPSPNIQAYIAKENPSSLSRVSCVPV